MATPIPGLTPPAGTGTPPAWRGGAYTGPRPQGFAVPQWVSGKDETERWSNFLTFLQQNPENRGNRILHRTTGFDPARGFQAPPPRPTTPAPAAPTAPTRPTPGPPVGSAPRPPVGTAPPPGLPPSGGGAGFPGGFDPTGFLGGPGPTSFEDPMSMFLAAVPAMRLNTQRQIGDAMASAGGTGNRWGTYAAGKAGEIGAQAAMGENAMLAGLLSDYANKQENRALAANDQAMRFGALQDQAARDRILLPFTVGQYEQGRQDDIASRLFQDWQQNRLGWLGPLLPLAGSQGPGSPGQIYTTTEPGKPGAIDWASLLLGLFK